MKLINGYLFKSVILGVIMALIVLVALDVLMAFIYQYNSHVRGDFGIVEVILYILYTIPRRIYDYFPTSMLLGGLLSLGAMATHSELIAIRAAGVPVKGIAQSVLFAGATLMLLVVILGEFVAPVAEERAESMKVSAQTGSLVSMGRTRLWIRDGNRFVGIRQVLPGFNLRGITVFDLTDDMRVESSVSARSASYDEENNQWILSKVRQATEVDKGIQYEDFERLELERLLSPDLFKVVVVSPEKMSAMSLFRYVEYLKANGLDASHYEMAFWLRFTTPISSLIMLLIALPFVFSSQRSGGFGQRLFFGILIGVVFFLFNRMLNHIGLVYGLPPALSASLPLLAFSFAAFWALKRIR